MKHQISLQGYGCLLRPVAIEDAPFIVHLRNQDFARRFVHDTSASLERQEDWLRRYLERPGDYYWIIEDAGAQNKPVGTLGLYDVKDGQAECGRWIMLPGTTFPLVATSLLVYEFAFKDLMLNRVVFDVVSTNRKVLKYHRLLREPETHIASNALTIQGASVDLVWFEVTRAFWLENKARWESFAL